MARTFSHQKNHRNNQQPQRTTWGKPSTTKRGTYSDLADRVRDNRLAITRRTVQAEEADEQKRPVSD